MTAGPEVGRPRIAVIGTLDTKGVELGYVCDKIRGLGCDPTLIDTGILGPPLAVQPEIASEDVALAAGVKLEDVQAAGSRGAAVSLMAEGLRATALSLWTAGRLDGALCLGGAEGALLGAAFMHALPLGVPKVLVSPSASGPRPFAPFVGLSDVLVMHSVVDILGVNPISRAIFDNAAAAVVGMVRDAGRPPVAQLDAQTVGVTMLGQTTPGVMALRDELEQAGWQVLVFHANGVGGPAMERLVEAGVLRGVIDYTVSELANTLMEGLHATGPERLRVAGRTGIPQVVVPGCADFFNQGPAATVPERFRSRPSYHHNPVATLVRLDHDEMAKLGEMMAERLAGASGPVRIFAPMRGFCLQGVEGQPLWDPVGDHTLVDALDRAVGATITVERVEADANDAAFARKVAAGFLSIAEV